MLNKQVIFLAALFITACAEENQPSERAAARPPVPSVAQPTGDTLPSPSAVRSSNLHFVVDKSERKLYVLRAGDTIRVEPVAVGMADHPTPTGEWKLHRVDWNPDWTPPPGEDWTEDKEPQPPGSAENPMGRARLVFQMPYTIHGTKEHSSLGKAVSHGSIRVDNKVVVELGRLLMEEGGAQKPESFFQDVSANRKRMRQVPLPNPTPITVKP